MTGARGPAPTRQNLVGLRRRRERVARGTALLRRKREALVAELFRLARPAASARASIIDQARASYPLLLDALGIEGIGGITPLGWPPRAIRVEIRPAQVWGIPVSELVAHPPIRRTLAARGTPPPSVGPTVASAATAFETLTELLLQAANREALLARLAGALSRTSRQVNTLELRVAPELERQTEAIRRTLDEREREEHLRLQRLLRSRAR